MICRGCGGKHSSIVFEMDPMPLAGGFSDSLGLAQKATKLPLVWRRCEGCWLVQVERDVPDEILYRNYCYASSSVQALCEHFDSYAEFLGDRYPGPMRVLEIGCNDGILLRRLPTEWECIGVDPSDVAEEANPAQENQSDRCYELINAPFNTKLGLRGFDLVLASNCLAHITEIYDVVEAAALALRPGGHFWVEVHDLEATLKDGQWDTIYHEHKVEYNLASLCRTLEPHGFALETVQKLSLHGGLIRAGFRKTEQIPNLFPFMPGHSFDLLVETYQKRREGMLYEELMVREDLVAYGASGRATVWFNQLPELKFQAVVDDSSLRQGKFVPGVGWPIVPWDSRPDGDCILITAWNYAQTIRNQHSEYPGVWAQIWT